MLRYRFPCLAALAFCYTAAQAQDAKDQPNLGLDDWLSWNTMTGDWGGLRQRLQDEGIVIRGHYVNEAAGNPVGGREQGGADTGEIGVSLDVDSKLLGWSGGTFHVLITQRTGSSLSKDKIDNLLTVQEIYGDGQTLRLTQLSYEQELLGGRIDVEAGRINTENDFATSPVYFGGSLYCAFQNNAICGTPIAAPVNSAGYVAYPASNWGARIKAYLVKDWYVETGAYAVDPTQNLAHHGFKFGLEGVTGVFTAVETGVTVGEGGYLGNYRIGAYYDNSDNESVASNLGTRYATPQNFAQIMQYGLQERAGRYGGWALADQTLELDPGSKARGVVAFAAFEWGDRATSLIPWYGEAGLLRQGTFPGRDKDSIAIGFAAAAVNSALQPLERRFGSPVSEVEYMVEANYGIAVAPWIELRPGLQYIWHPLGETEIPNALVLMMKSVLTF